VVRINRNQWAESIGIGGRLRAEYAIRPTTTEPITVAHDRQAAKNDSQLEPEEHSEGLKERIILEGKALYDKSNRRWKLKDIAKEITSNKEIRDRLKCGYLAEGTIERYLRGQGIGKKGRPTEPIK